MSILLKIISLYLMLLPANPAVEIYIYGENSVRASTNCKTEVAEFDYNISTNTKEAVKAYSFDLGETEFEIYHNNKKISRADTVYFDSQKPVSLKFRYKINSLRPAVFKFTTDKGIKLFNSTKITYGDHDLSVEHIKKRNVHVFNVSKTCNDSIRIHFPPGGTITTVALYKVLNSGEKEFKTVIGIWGGDEVDHFSFSRKDIGRYFVRYSSCHWGKRFWITVK